MKIDSMKFAVGSSLAGLSLGGFIESEMSEVLPPIARFQGSIQIAVERETLDMIVAKIAVCDGQRKLLVEGRGHNPETASHQAIEAFQAQILPWLKVNSMARFN